MMCERCGSTMFMFGERGLCPKCGWRCEPDKPKSEPERASEPEKKAHKKKEK